MTLRIACREQDSNLQHTVVEYVMVGPCQDEEIQSHLNNNCSTYRAIAAKQNGNGLTIKADVEVSQPLTILF